MSADEMEFDTQADEPMQTDEHDEQRADDEQTSTQQALKQLNQLTGSNGTAATTTKIAAVPIASTSSVTATAKLQKPEAKLANAKIVYIKNANGTQTPLHIPSGSQATSLNKPVQLVQLPKPNVVQTAGAPNSTRILLKGAQKFILASSTVKAAANSISAASGTAAGRPISVSQAHQIGLIAGVPKTVAAAQATSASTAAKAILLPSTSGTASIALKNPPTILNKGVKPIQASNIVTLAGSNQQVRKVNVPGKGVQLVRVVNALPSSSAANATATKVVNGRQQQVIVQRKLPQHTSQIAGTSKSQFVTKKLEVMPMSATTKIIKKEPVVQTVKAPPGFLLNAKKPIASTSIDIKPVIPADTDSIDNTEKKPAPRTYSANNERKSKSPEPSNLMYSTLKLPSPEPMEGIRRKHCNCTKSQCLKLYCDCFANGEFCSNCNCKECFNTLEKEDERQKAIKICLERNPHAFKPKIGKARDQSDALRRHTKGCNCKRSGCLKNYCECYEAKIVCSANCKCIGCRNIDDHNDSMDRDNGNMDLSQMVKRTYSTRDAEVKQEPVVPPKKPCNFITPDVIEATVQCIIAQADDCLKNNSDTKTTERKILEEFGRCLVEIIEFSKKNNESADE